MPRKPKPKKGAPDPSKRWVHNAGTGAERVTAFERPERGCQIFLRYEDPERVVALAKDPRTSVPTGLAARSKVGEEFDPFVLADAVRRAGMLSAQLTTKTYRRDDAETNPDVMTLKRGIELSLATDGSGRLSYRLDGNGAPVLQSHDLALRSRLETFQRLWQKHASRGNPVPTFHTFSPADVTKVLTWLAEEHQTSAAAVEKAGTIEKAAVATTTGDPAEEIAARRVRRRTMHGISVVEKMLSDVYAIAGWLRQKGLIGPTECLPLPRWKVALKENWMKATTDGGDVPKPNRPRLTRAQMHALWSALDDPRAELARVMARDARLYAFAPLKWSDLRLSPTPHAPHGAMRYEDAKDNVYFRALTADTRALLDEALTTGYLRDYEAARRRGALTDYHVFAAGPLQQLTAGQVPSLWPMPGGSTPLSPTGVNVLTIDPRLKLALDIAPTLRLGQVARLMRKQVDLAFEIVDDDTGAVTVGGFAHVPGRGKKQSPGALLQGAALAAMRSALSEGYLEHFEAEYKAGRIKDYPIFPGGQFVVGKANPQNPAARQPANRTAFRQWFKELEIAAGIAPKKGRLWNGLRRLIADETPRLTSNTVVRSRVSGTSERTLAAVYRDKESRREAIEAGNVAAALRALGRPSGSRVAPSRSADALHSEIAPLVAGRSPQEIAAALALYDQQRSA